MAVNVGSLLVTLGLDSGEFKSGLSVAEKDLRKAQRNIENIGKGMSNLGRNMSLAVTAPLTAIGITAVKAAVESRDALAQVDAALASMGGAAGRTSEQLKALAENQMSKSLYDDDEILRKVTANLLTFGNIAREQFDGAQQAVINLSARMGTDLQASALQIGKALNDPVKGLNSLKRAGIQFTEQQKAQIKSMAEAGDMAGAQSVMLKELERQFGGAAAAARQANPFAAIKQSFAEFQESVGEQLLKILPNITAAIERILGAFNQLSPGMQQTVVIAGLLAAAFGPVLTVMGSLVTATAGFTGALHLIATSGTAAGAGAAAAGAGVATASAGAVTATGAFAALKAGLAGLATVFGPFAIAAAAVGAAAVVIYQNWDKIAPVLQEFWDAASEALGPPLRELISTISQALTDLWNGPLGSLIRTSIGLIGEFASIAQSAFGSVAVQALRALLAIATEVFSRIGDGIRGINALLRGDWQAAWNSAGGGATSILAMVRDRILDLMGPIGMVIAGLNRLAGMPAKAGGGINKFVGSAAGMALDQFQQLQTAAATMRQRTTAAVAGAVGGGAKTKGGGGRKRSGGGGKSAEDIAREAAENAARFEDSIGRIRVDILQAEAEYSQNVTQRRDASLAAINEELASFERQIALDKNLTDARRAELLAARRALAEQERKNVEQEYGRDIENQRADVAQAAMRLEMNDLQLRADMADNSRDRLAAELAIFDLGERLREAELDRILAVEATASAAWENAKAEKEWLAATRAARQSAVERNNMSPLQKYGDEIHRTAGEMNDALEGVAVRGFGALEDGLVDAMVNFRSLGDVARQVIGQIAADLARLAIQKAISGALGSVFGSVFGGGFGGGVSTAGMFDFGIGQAYAKGTNFAPGGIALVGEEGPELVNLRRGSQVISNDNLREWASNDNRSVNVTVHMVASGNPKADRESSIQLSRTLRRDLNPVRGM